MIPAAYSTALKNAIQAYSYADRVAIWRTVNQSDGIGGISQHWIQVAEIRATISNTGDTEGIVGGMHHGQAPAILHVSFQAGLNICGPLGGVVVRNDHLVLRKIRVEVTEILTRFRRRHHIHLKQARVFQLLLQDRRGQLPLVIRSAALAIQQHNLQGSCRWCGGGYQTKSG